jgi:uracil-DNA glycosylase
MSGDPSSGSRRAAAQQLSSLRAAGVTRIASRSRKSGGTSSDTKSVSVVPPAPAATACSRSASLFNSPQSTVPRAEREEKLRILSARVAQCVRCAELSATRTQTVFGVGNPEARIMFVGEAPGADEDRQGEPFVGAAGQLLNRILEACQLKRAEIYICNILRCRPPGNRTPAPEEAANCREYLDGQIEIVDPEYIVCLGSVAAKNLLGSMDAIGKLRGRFFNYGRAKVLCTYHPAYLLRNPAAKKDVWGDMKFLMHDLGVEL